MLPQDRTKALRHAGLCLPQSPGRFLRPLLALLLSVLVLTGTVPRARADVFTGPCRLFGVPPLLAMAMARVESDWYPWCLNVEGRDVRPRSYGRAVQLARDALRAGKSVDVGLMQINSYWLKKLRIAPEVALVPRNNVILGLFVLTQELRRHGATWKAVGAYHSPTAWRQQRYARKVHACYVALLKGQAAPKRQERDRASKAGRTGNRKDEALLSLTRPLPEFSEKSSERNAERSQRKVPGRAR